MVRTGLLVLLLTSGCLGAAELTLTLDSTTIERGRLFIGQLHYHGKRDDGPADLRPWEKHFHIERSNFSRRQRENGIDSSEDIRLYPRFSGDGVIDAIAHGGVIMEPIRVTVTPLRRNGIDGDPVLAPLPKTARVGVPVPVAVTVPLLSPGNEVNAMPWEADGFTVQPLPALTIDENGQQAVKLRWLLYPQIKGDHQLDLPVIQQRGHGRWRFHLPLQQLRVMPLPSYLPPTLPVGAISATSRAVTIDGHPHWELTLHGKGRIDDHPWGLHDAIVRATGIDEEAIVAIGETVAADGLRHKRWRFPVPRWTLPWPAGPALALRWYDPDEGRVRTLRHRLERAGNLPSGFGGLLVLAMAIAAIAAGGPATRGVRRLFTWWRQQRRLRAATTADTLRRALLEHGGHRHLEAWAAARNSVCATQAAAELNALCFGRQAPAGFDTVKAKVRHVESARQRLLRASTRTLTRIFQKNAGKTA